MGRSKKKCIYENITSNEWFVYECTLYCIMNVVTRLDLLMEAQSALEVEVAVVSSEAEAETSVGDGPSGEASEIVSVYCVLRSLGYGKSNSKNHKW